MILLRYVELDCEVERGLTALKMRGSGHDKRIQSSPPTTADSIERPFRGVAGILAGHAMPLPDSDDDLGDGATGPRPDKSRRRLPAPIMAEPSRPQYSTARSSRGLGHHPLKVETRVRIPYGLQVKVQVRGDF
jgi:hypothetical protein